MTQVIKSNEDKLTFGKYIHHSISNTPINYLVWAIVKKIIIIDNISVNLAIYQRKLDYDKCVRMNSFGKGVRSFN